MDEGLKIRIAIPEIGQDVRNYVNAVRGIGAEPVVISVSDSQLNEAIQQEYLSIEDFRPENYDGLLLPGGVDIEPTRYGQKNGKCVGIVHELDELQLSVLDACVKQQLPTLGICRGHQLINVYFDGTLIQDLKTADRHARYSLAEPDKRHVSHANHGSWLSRIYGVTIPHNSAHHQGVGKVGTGLVVDSRCSEDGVVEAMHHETLPIITVQWHPERMAFAHLRPDTVDGSALFYYFLGMCTRSRKHRKFEEGAML